MISIARRTMLAATGAALALPAIGRPARAAEFSFKFGNDASPTHPVNIRANEMARRVKADTHGRVEIQVFPDSALGSDTDMLSQVRSGAMQMMTLSGLILSVLVSEASINGVGFAFPNYNAVWKAMDGPLGAYVRGRIGKSGLLAMDRMWDNGFREITSSNKPIRTPADLAGFRIRVPVSPLWTSLFTDLGASPVSINFAELYSALQTHVVDGEEQPLVVIDTSKLYEVQKFCSLTNHMWDGYWFLVNPRAWNRLPPDLRTIVSGHINDAALLERADVAKLNASLQGTLEQKGLKFNPTDPEPFKAKLTKAGFYRHWKSVYGSHAWGLLEEVTGKLG